MTVLAGAVFAGATSSQLAALQQPWIVVDLHGSVDNQPRRAFRVVTEAGTFLTPALTLAGILAGEYLHSDRASDGSGAAAEAGARVNAGSGRLSAALGAGALLGAPHSTDVDAGARAHLLWDVTGALRIAGDISLRAGSQRTRYTATAASIDTVVLQRRTFIALDRAAAPGVAGEVHVRSDDYGDDNPVRTAYGWLLLPVSRGAAHSLRIGYSLARQDSDESRWRTDDARRGPPRGPNATSPDSIPGRYDPYHTPHDLTAHSAIAHAAAKAGGAWLTLDAAWAVHATELAPVLHRTTPQADPVLVFGTRSFSPRELRASLTTPLDAATSLTIQGVYRRTAFYRQSAIGLRIARSL